MLITSFGHVLLRPSTDPPEIIKKPQNQGVRVGGVASFYCAARGDPPPSIVWRKNGKKVSGKLLQRALHPMAGFLSPLNWCLCVRSLQERNLVTRCWSSPAGFPYYGLSLYGRAGTMPPTSVWLRTVWAMPFTQMQL